MDRLGLFLHGHEAENQDGKQGDLLPLPAPCAGGRPGDFLAGAYPVHTAWYYEQRRPDDLIISASPEFLLAPAARMLEFALIASPVEQATGLYRGENCHGPEKPRRYRAVYGDEPVEGFWSDSRSDAPMAALAAHAHLVKGTQITDW